MPGENFAPPLILVIGDGTRLLFIESRAMEETVCRLSEGELLLGRLIFFVL